jgi:uncharacterized protein YbbK (DUF523 family)
MEKILVSACLLGDKTRYDGKDNYCAKLEALQKKYELVPFCPEVEAGLSIPRDPAEIRNNQVITSKGVDLTKAYDESAEKAYRICSFLGIKIAILKDNSPSCGPRHIHDGKFDDVVIDGLGVTARYLISKGIKVYAETDELSFLLSDKPVKANPFAPKREKDKYIARQRNPEGENADGSFEKKPYSHSSRYGERKTGYGHSSYHKSYSHDGEGTESEGYHKSYGKPSYSHSSNYHSHSGYSSYHHDDDERKDYGDKEHSYSKNYGHSNYGHSSYGHNDHSGYGHNDHSGYGHSSEGKSGYGHSSYGHNDHKEGYGHSSYGHSSYGHSKYSSNKGYGDKKRSYSSKPRSTYSKDSKPATPSDDKKSDK